MDPFLDVQVQPLYGAFRALISWKVIPEYEAATFTGCKSTDGLNGWDPIGAVTKDNHLVDDNLVSQGKLQEQYYQVMVTKGDGKVFKSPMVGTFGKVNREEFGAARRIMEMEYQSLRKFIKIHLCKFKAMGDSCKRCVDPDTDQAVGTSRCPECFGTKKEGGFYPPVITYMRPMSISPTVQQDSPEMAGTTDPITLTARMPGFPLLRKDDLLVHKETDRRYLVETVEPSWFAAKVPVVFMVKLVQLATNDMRYDFPI